MEELLGKQGLQLFQDALKEKVGSREFNIALWANSVKTYKGSKPPETFLYLILSGASGAGKSTSGAQAIAREYPEQDDSPEFKMAWVDGGIGRDINLMQPIIKRLSIELGVEVTDLYDQSQKILKVCKKKIKDAVITNPTPAIGIVAPETFSDFGYGEEIETIKKLKESKNVHVSYDFVGNVNMGKHRKIVKEMAERRAFDPPSAQADKYKIINSVPVPERLEQYQNESVQKMRLAEGKAYGASGYQPGVIGSLKGFGALCEEFGGAQNANGCFTTHFNFNDLELYDEQGEIWNEKSTGEQVVASVRLHEAWKTQDDGAKFKDYASEHWKEYKNIMIAYAPGALQLQFAPKLDELLKKRIEKRSSLLRLSDSTQDTEEDKNLSYLIRLLKELNPIFPRNF